MWKKIVCLLCLLPVVGSAQRGSQGYTAQLYQGQASLRANRLSTAAYHFRTALEWNQDGADAHIGLGTVYLQTGKEEKAVDEFQAALRLRPHSAEAERLIHTARERSNKGQEEKAFQALEEQVKHDTKNPDIHTTYAEELVERNRLDEAQREALLALKLDSKQGHAYCALGRIAMIQGKETDAQKYWETALHYDNTDDDALSGLGDVAMKAKDFRRAADYYHRVIVFVPGLVEGHKKYLEALTGLGDTRRAEKEKAVIERLTSKGG
jgi:Tfp pilus assembly protein PilF